MALPVDDSTPTDTPFLWGASGARMTPEQIAARRKVSDALMTQSGDYSPIRSVWQGIARAAQGISGGIDAGMTDRADKANASDNAKMIAALLGGGGASAPASVATQGTAPAAVASSPAPAAAPEAAPGTPDGERIYNEKDMDNPFEPSAADRDNTIRTVYGEAANEPPQGQLAVASVIRNRTFDGGYGGNTASAVVHAPNQFEPWNGGPATARMNALSPDDPKYIAIGKVVDAANGTDGRAPDDPTDGKTMFYAPAAQAALGRPAPSWAKGDGQVIGGHTFFDAPDDAPAAKPVQVADASGAVPAGVARAATASVAPVAAAARGGLGAVSPAVLQAMTSPYASPATKQIAGLLLQQQMTPKDVHTQETDAKGNVWDVNTLTGQRTVALKQDPAYTAPYRDDDGNLVQKDATGKISVVSAADKTPNSVSEYKYYKENLPPGQAPMDYGTWSTAKARAGATNVSTNVDMGSSQTYDKQLAEGLGKSHAALANGVEDAQSRARDIAAMQGAVDKIQAAGGTTGGMLPAQRLELQKSINAGAAALGIDKPFSEDDISDKEFLTKFNRSMAGAQAKNAVGSRVTNFEMSNFLKANPGLDMSITGNQRLLGIQGQIEQRNIAVGNAIRDATASAISQGKKIDPVTVQGIITKYDTEHHISDPTTGQDLTQSYALPEFQTQGNNPALATDHATNIGKMRRFNPITGNIE